MTSLDSVIDRIAPTLRPDGRLVMRQDWHDLLFLHWAMPADELQPLVPPSLTIDTYDGNAYIGLVPFRMTGVRPTWFPPVPGISSFLEINVRTYVQNEGRDPGVWFFSLDAANVVAVALARALFKLPYFLAAMRQTQRQSPGSETSEITYRSRRLYPGPVPAGCDLNYAPHGELHRAQPGTLEHFLIERYILYSAQGKALYRGRVHHTAYPVQTAVVTRLDENLIAASGIQRPASAPLVHFARGVQVEIFPLERLV